VWITGDNLSFIIYVDNFVFRVFLKSVPWLFYDYSLQRLFDRTIRINSAIISSLHEVVAVFTSQQLVRSKLDNDLIHTPQDECGHY
jgi:hypothetical protein